ncbi:MAG TPA: hypothetical protein VF397_01880 [Pyrinomonadaceae bacterium]
MRGKVTSLTIVLIASAFLLGMESVASAQGRGRGQGGPPAGVPAGGPPSGVGVGRGIGTSSDRSNGRADTGRSTASDRSNGRSVAGLDRAALQRQNAQSADKDLNNHPEMAARLHTTANDLRSGYQAALLTNPNLKFGQYVAATRLAANLNARFPNVTTGAILGGLAKGNSIGQTLQSLGVGKDQARDAERAVDREIKEAKKH